MSTATISASLVKELRDETNLGMMECKKALVETAGDKERAVKLLRERVPGADGVVFSVHCHNDLGMAVANTIAGIKAGARRV